MAEKEGSQVSLPAQIFAHFQTLSINLPINRLPKNEMKIC